jgi:serine protease Do
MDVRTRIDVRRGSLWLATGLLFGLAGAAQAALPTPGAQDPVREAVDTAIAQVYPALVRIHVVEADYNDGREVKGESSGSGVIISPEGHVVTNHHVAGKARRIWCTLSTREEVEATLIGTDALSDIAVLKLDTSGRKGQPFPVARFGDSGSLRVGDRVLAMGSPRALSQSVTLGIVSNLEMTFPRFFWPATFRLDGEETGSLVRWIGHDAQIFPGNSGGPLVSLSGEIVGINEISLGLSGAIPGNLAHSVAEELIRTGSVRRSWLGVTLQPLLKDDPRGEGTLVSSVVSGSPADKAGLKAGDVLIGYQGQKLRARYAEELPEINRLMLDTPPDTKVVMRYVRDGKEASVTAETVVRGAAQGDDTELHAWGLAVRDLTLLSAKELDREPGSGVLVGSVRPGGPSHQAKPALQPGDIIVEFRGQPVRTAADLVRLTAESANGAAERAPSLVGFERRSQRLLTVVSLGERDERDRSAEAVKAWLPVTTQVLTPDLAEALDLKGRTGVRVTHVTSSSTATAAGLQVGDVLLKLDGDAIAATQLEDAEVFAALIRQYRVGAKVALEGVRAGKPFQVQAELAPSPRAPRELPEYKDQEFEFTARDLTFQDRLDWRLDPTQRGVLVTSVETGGWGALAQLAVGDVVLAIDGGATTSLRDLQNRMERIATARPRHVVFMVRRGVSSMFIELEPTWTRESLRSGGKG